MRRICGGLYRFHRLPRRQRGSGGYNFAIILSRLNPSGSSLDYTLEIPSPVANAGHGAALDGQGDIYLTGAQNVPSDLYAAKLSESGGTTPPPTPTPLPSPTPTPVPASSAHIGDLDGLSAWIRVNRAWRAQVQVQVHDANEAPLANAMVAENWSGDYSGADSCTTDSQGYCSLTTSRLNRQASSVTFTVTGVSRSGYTYQPGANHDPDGDSNGTVISIFKP